MKKLFKLLYGLPVLLFFIAALMNLAADSNGEVIYGTNLFVTEMFFGTMMSPIFIYFTFSIIGIALLLNKKTEIKNIGRALYSIAMISSLLLYRLVGIELEFISEDNFKPDNSLALGGILLLVSAIIGIIIVFVFIIVPIAKDILGYFYGTETNQKRNNTVLDNNPFDELRSWKAMVNDSVITEDEYVNIKEETLKNIKFKKSSKIDTINLLKEVEVEGLITNEDFTNIKKELI